MPKFGTTNARAGKPTAGRSAKPAGARADKKVRGANSTANARGGSNFGSNFKVREDGRGGRAPQRQDREMRDGRPDRGRDWSPSTERPAGRKPRHSAVERSERFQRDDRAPRRDFGDRPRRDFDDRAPRKDFAERGPRRDFGDRPERNERRDFADRPRRDFADRPRRDSGERFERDDRAPRREFGDRPRFGDRDDRRGPRREFGDRPERSERRSFDDRPRRDFENGRPDRADRVARDRDRDASFAGARSANPNKKAFFEDKVLERLEAVPQSEAITEDTFEAMGLHPRVLVSLAGMGAEKPFPIQASTIPAAISGMDVLGRGKTGSGKTIAFTVPLVTKLIAAGSVPRKPGKPRALILAPTRELADQIDRTVNGIARPVGFYTLCIYGGVPQRKQENAMSRGVDIVVATPGRLEDLMAQGIVDLSEVETVVVDEADHMCDLGFIEGVRRILAATGDSQKLLFSATLDREVDALVKQFLPAPYVFEVPDEEQDHSNIIHRVLTVDDLDRSAVLLRLVQGEGKALIFARTKMTAERLSESLTAAGVPAARLHGDLNQNQRNRNLERFTKGHVRVLVATDVAARGIHVDDVSLVIQVDPPQEYKTYLHRSGRTGRAHSTGTVVTLIPRSRRRRMEDLLKRAERDGIFSDVRPSSELLEQLAGPIAPPPAVEMLDFGDSRGGDRGDRGGRGRSGDRGGRGFGGDRGGRGEGRGFSGGRGRGEGARGGERSGPRTKSRKFDN
ncbi:MAG: hypothetical protein RIR16_89 [Actinomycetota bacterium]